MSDEPTPSVEAEPPPTATPSPKPETDWKAEARKWEERAKANKGAAERLTELEEAAKSDLQKALERAEAAEAESAALAAQRQLDAWKSEVSTATNIPAHVLAGSTLEELEAHASAIRALIADQGLAASVGPYVPSEDPGASTSGLGGPAQVFAAHLTKQRGR